MKLKKILMRNLSLRLLALFSLTFITSLEARDLSFPFIIPSLGLPSFPDSLEAYMEETNLLGNTRGATSLTLDGYQKLIASAQLTISQGAVLDCHNLDICNTQGPMIFVNNSTQKAGGTFFANKLQISGNNGFILFSNNSARNSSTDINASIFSLAGAIRADQLGITNNKQPVYFLMNSSVTDGGAIQTTNTITLSDNKAPCLFYSNLSLWDTGRGGAIRTNSFESSKNTKDILFIDNRAGTGGGIASYGGCTFSNNQGNIVFSNNVSSNLGGTNNSNGGGITANSLGFTGNSGKIIFQNNSSTGSGGAVQCSSLNISENHDIYFLDNSAEKGGAISSGSLSISADYGNVTFSNNLCLPVSGDIYRNAINVGNNSKIELGAKYSRAILFYDPIEHDGTGSSIVINPHSDHQGCVVFSGATVYEDLKTEKNLFSQSKTKVELKNGVLAIEDGAGIATYQFEQTGGRLCLGSGGTLAAKEQSDSVKTATATITDLGLNLPSLLSGSQPAKLWIYPSATTTAGATTTFAENTAASITLSGNLTLTDEEGNNPYDTLDLSQGRNHIPLLYLCDNTASKITLDNLNVNAINDTEHYGYQGLWALKWEAKTTVTDSTSADKANTNHKYLYGDWTPTHYLPNPKYQTVLVANALWETFYTTMSSMRTFPDIMEIPAIFELQGQGLITSIHQDNRLKKPGFRMESSGYAVGTSSVKETQQRISFSFAQHFAHLKEKESENKLSSKNYVAGMQLRLPWFDKDVITTTTLIYNYGSHKTKHNYRKENKISRGDFYSHSFAASFNTTFELNPIYEGFDCALFIEAMAFRGSLSSFSEIGDYARSFAVIHPLYNVTLPMGILCQWSHDVHLLSSWKLQLAYHPVIYRHYPELRTTLLTSKGSWESEGTHVARNALAFAVGNETYLFSNLKVFLDYQANFSSSTFCNYLKAGSTLEF
ncbi:polymorphic outer membrane protein middle domain-containing protein [Chlamydia crocodili]|uniref:Pmp family polymorphic membrane protein autotransporter adhesin n=1 Tax=Chlamydia crocodili TaxID=2766982 RepID=A0ABX8CCU4_9CHLA|nr:polymorphic outer membrane protein middle domain-containing protein [Chlamydia crocodili]QVE48825.1 Pmp family polymorphic membrane protein autotransporter adhesin [Chlamydia crocodili]